MKRPLAVFCFVFALTRLAASYLPLAAYVPLAAIFVFWLIFCSAKHKNGYIILLPVYVLAAIVVQTIYMYEVIKINQLALTEHDLQVRVESAVPGVEEGTARAELLVYKIDGQFLPIRKRFKISCADFPEFQTGEMFEGKMFLKSIKNDRYKWNNLSNKIYLTAELKEVHHIGRAYNAKVFFARLNQKMAASIRKYLPKEEGAVLTAMSLGNRTGITPDLRECYRKAGVSHLLVVSGLHLSLICGAFLSNRPIGGRFRRLKAFGALCMAVFVMLLTGAGPSMRRATIAAVIFYMGALLLKSADSFTSLGIAAFCAGFSGPYAYCNLGLQLSFAATFGILVASSELRLLKRHMAQSKVRAGKLIVFAAKILFCPLMAALFTLPIQLIYGLDLSGVSVITNLLVTAFVGPILVCGFLTGVLGMVPGVEFAVRSLALVGGMLTRMVNHIVAFCADMSMARVVLPRAFTVYLWIVLAFAILGLRWIQARGSWWAALYLAICPSLLFYTASTSRVVRVESVGRAEQPCMILRENQETVVVLQGGAANERAVLKFLDRQNIQEVSLLVDMRKEPQDIGIAAQEIVNVYQQKKGLEQSQRICDIMTLEVRLSDGALFLADILGYKLALCTGTCALDTPLNVDILLAGQNYPQGIHAKTTAVCGRFDWQSEIQNKVYYAPNGFLQMVRPGFMAQCYGGSDAL